MWGASKTQGSNFQVLLARSLGLWAYARDTSAFGNVAPGTWGSFHNIPEAIFCLLLQGDYNHMFVYRLEIVPQSRKAPDTCGKTKPYSLSATTLHDAMLLWNHITDYDAYVYASSMPSEGLALNPNYYYY